MNYIQENFITSLSVPSHTRTSRDKQCIRAYFKTIEALKNYNEQTIIEFASVGRYEHYYARSQLYRRGDFCASWYIVVSGCVLIENSLFLPQKSFGHRPLRSMYRTEDCIVMDDTGLIVLDYSDKQVQIGSSKRSPRQVCPSVNENHPLPEEKSGDSSTLERGTTFNDSSMNQSTSPVFDRVFDSDSMTSSDYTSNRLSHASESSSQLSTKTSTSKEDLASTSDDDSIHQDTSSQIDPFTRALTKAPDERTDDDIDTMLDGIYNLPAFSRFSQKTQRDLCRVQNTVSERNAEVKIIEDGFVYDTWNVILTGTIEMRRRNGSVDKFQRGHSFGVREGKERKSQDGDVWTVTPVCLFFSVRQRDFYSIISRKDETFIPEKESNGRISLVYEDRSVSSNVSPKTRVVIKGTAEKLLQCLIEESDDDPTYMETFLLTYRVFMASPKILAKILCDRYAAESSDSDSKVKATIRNCLIFWANNHFEDMDNPETDMNEYLERFNAILSETKYSAQALTLFQLVCTNNAKIRQVTINTDKNYKRSLPFRLIGLQGGWGLYIKEMNPAYTLSRDLRCGDQILTVGRYSWEMLESIENVINTLSFEKIPSITLEVKYNPAGLQKLLSDLRENQLRSEGGSSHTKTLAMGLNLLYSSKRNSITQVTPRNNITRSGSVVSVKVNANGNSGPKPMGVPQINAFAKCSSPPYTKTKIRSANTSPDRGSSRPRCPSRCSPVPENMKIPNDKLYQHVCQLVDEDANTHNPNSSENAGATCQVIKVFRPNVSDGKLISLTDKTTAKEALRLILKEYDINEIQIEDYSLCVVTVKDGSLGVTKTFTQLPMYTKDLAGHLSLNQRYYLKSAMASAPLISDDQARAFLAEANVSFSQLTAFEVATRLTFLDYASFREIQTAEYINFVFKLPPIKPPDEIDLDHTEPNGARKKAGFSLGCSNYLKFQQLLEEESYWTATEICRETNLNKRVDIIKKFIQIAKMCKTLKNFHSMMCILMGLDMNCVTRLKSSWDKLSNKHQKTFHELRSFLCVDFNFKLIRQQEFPEFNIPPLIPWLATHSKDFAANIENSDTVTKDGLINFDKFRKVALEIRKLRTMCATNYTLETILSLLKPNPNFTFSQAVADITSNNGNTVKKTRSHSVDQISFFDSMRHRTVKRSSINPVLSQSKSPKKIYEEWFSTLKVRTYLLNRRVEMDSKRLLELSNALEPPNIATNSGSNSSSVSSMNKSPDIKHSRVPLSTGLSKTNLMTHPSQDSVFESPLNDRPLSIFSYQNPDNDDRIKELVQNTKNLTSGTKTISRRMNGMRHHESYLKFDDKLFKPLTSPFDDNYSDEAKTPSATTNVNCILLSGGITSDFHTPLTDTQLERPIRRHDNFPPAAESLNNNYYKARPAPSNINTNQDNSKNVTLRKDPRPLPPPRKDDGSKC